jgi:signal transduction histidine kinase
MNVADLSGAEANSALENRLREQAAQLKAAGEELDAFVYSISHDLRAPLRAIGGFAAALEEDFATQLDPQARDYLRRICGGVERMTQMIEELLQLSRLTRGDMRYEETDLGAIAASVANALKARTPGRRVEFVLDANIPATRCDARLMRVALEKLLDNAFKFTAKADPARIRFDCTPVRGELVLSIQDNGVGFDPANAGRLFAPFVRLHAASEFPGSGTGLAAARRIIQRHGGRVWAESTPGKGASFYFTLEPRTVVGGALPC